MWINFIGNHIVNTTKLACTTQENKVLNCHFWIVRFKFTEVKMTFWLVRFYSTTLQIIQEKFGSSFKIVLNICSKKSLVLKFSVACSHKNAWVSFIITITAVFHAPIFLTQEITAVKKFLLDYNHYSGTLPLGGQYQFVLYLGLENKKTD